MHNSREVQRLVVRAGKGAGGPAGARKTVAQHHSFSATLEDVPRRERYFVNLQSRGLLALPRAIRDRAGLDRPGAQVEVVERDDGVIELHPYAAVPADQAWFWTERWQEMEREVDEQIAHGEVETFETSEDFLAYLDTIKSGS